MPKDKSIATPLEAAQLWMAKHKTENLDLKALTSAVVALEKNTTDAQAAAAKLGAVLEARKVALKTLKETLKAAKAARKNPVPPKAAPAKKPSAKVAPAKPAAPSAPAKKAVVKKVLSPKPVKPS